MRRFYIILSTRYIKKINTNNLGRKYKKLTFKIYLICDITCVQVNIITLWKYIAKTFYFYVVQEIIYLDIAF